MSGFIYAIDSNLFYSVSSFKIMIRAFSLHLEDYGNGLRLFWSFKTHMALLIFLLQRKCWKTLKSVILSREWVHVFNPAAPCAVRLRRRQFVTKMLHLAYLRIFFKLSWNLIVKLFKWNLYHFYWLKIPDLTLFIKKSESFVLNVPIFERKRKPFRGCENQC